MSVGEFPLPKTEMSRTFPGMQDRKTAEAGKTPLGPIGDFFFVRWQFFFCRLGKQNVGPKKNMPAVRNANLLVRRSIRKSDLYYKWYHS